MSDNHPFKKEGHLAIRQFCEDEKIVFVDGMWGSGKSIIAPILGGFQDVEMMKIDESFELISLLETFGKIETNAGVMLLQLFADKTLYNMLISREVNFRPSDDSGVMNNPNKWEYISRLFIPGGDGIIESTKQRKPILQIASHILLPFINLPFKAYGERLRVVEMVRHPLFLVEHWYNYLKRYEGAPKLYNISIQYENELVPWFASGWEGRYQSLSLMDKTVAGIEKVTELIINKYSSLSEQQRQQIVTIPFEKFVKEPWPFISSLEKFLGKNANRAVAGALKRQKCPRNNLTAGRGKKRHGWKKPAGKTNDSELYEQKMEFLRGAASQESLSIMERLSSQYEEKFGIVIN